MIADLHAPRGSTIQTSSNGLIAVSDKARAMPDSVLVAAETIGFGGALAVLVWTPRTLELVFLATALGALGLWGVSDHMFESSRNAPAPLRWTLSGFRLAIATVGVTAAMAAGYALIGRLMGVFIL